LSQGQSINLLTNDHNRERIGVICCPRTNYVFGSYDTYMIIPCSLGHLPNEV